MLALLPHSGGVIEKTAAAFYAIVSMLALAVVGWPRPVPLCMLYIPRGYNLLIRQVAVNLSCPQLS
jgi:hypothetical protein